MSSKICRPTSWHRARTGTGGKPSTWFPPGGLVELTECGKWKSPNICQHIKYCRWDGTIDLCNRSNNQPLCCARFSVKFTGKAWMNWISVETKLKVQKSKNLTNIIKYEIIWSANHPWLVCSFEQRTTVSSKIFNEPPGGKWAWIKRTQTNVVTFKTNILASQNVI